MTGITFDTGALIALERRRQRMKEIVERALARDQPLTVPADVVGEWWRGPTCNAGHRTRETSSSGDGGSGGTGGPGKGGSVAGIGLNPAPDGSDGASAQEYEQK